MHPCLRLTSCSTLAVAFALTASGCTNSKPYAMTADLGAPTVHHTSIKTRALVFQPMDRKDISASTRPIVGFCAEPSPDALSTLSTQFTGEAGYEEQLSLALTLAQQEAGSFVGLRTQSIQLLRDAMYRMCEAYLSGALQPEEYSLMLRRYLRTMVVLLAIEQMTQVVQAPAASHSASGAASAPGSALAIVGELDKLDAMTAATTAELEDLKKQQAAINAEKVDDKDQAAKDGKAARLKVVDAAIAGKEATIKRQSEVRLALLEGLKGSRSALSSQGTATATSAAAAVARAQLSEVAIKAVEGLAKDVFEQDDLGSLCYIQATKPGNLNVKPVPGSLLAYCIKAIESGEIKLQNLKL